MARKQRRAKQGRPSSVAVAGNHWARTSLIVFSAALAIRLLYVVSIRDAYFLEHLQTDAERYFRWAALIADGGTFPRPPFEQAPGYAYFVAIVDWLFGTRVMPVVLVQAVLAAATCACIAVTAQLAAGALAGWIAGLLAASYGPFIHHATEILPDTLFVFLAAAAVASSFVAGSGATTAGRQRLLWTGSGLLWATAFLVRIEIALAFPFVIVDAYRRGTHRAAWRAGMPMAVAMALLLSLNFAHGSRVVLFTTSGGINLWLGNNPHADGVSPFLRGPLLELDRELRAAAPDAADLDRTYAGQALSFWRQHPGQAAALLWKKFLWTWTNRELPNTADVEWKTAHSWLFLRPFFPLSFGMILPLAFAGAICVRRRTTGWLPLLGLVVVGAGVPTVFFTNARFRLIMLPALLVLAGLAPAQLRRWRSGRANFAALAAALFGAMLAWGDHDGVRSYTVPEITVNTGILERAAGNYAAAEHHLRAGLKGNPADDIAWIHLALALEQAGRPAAALQAYLDGLENTSGNRRILEMSRRFCGRQGIDAAMLREYLQASDVRRRRLADEMRERLRDKDALEDSLESSGRALQFRGPRAVRLPGRSVWLRASQADFRVAPRRPAFVRRGSQTLVATIQPQGQEGKTRTPTAG